MSYRLKPREKLAGGLQRIFCEEIRSAARQTRAPQKRGEAVHELRKHLKKLRAALGLVAGQLGKRRHDRVDRSIREVAKLVSGLRDAHVRLQTVVQLREQFPDRTFKKVFQRVEDLLSMELTSFSAAYAGWDRQAAPKLRAIEKRVSKWRMNDITWKDVCRAVAKSYRRGQNRLADALKKRESEQFHSWRKEVKDLWYQLRLLAPLNRVVLEEIARDAKTLGGLLGQHHDLAFLLSRLDLERDNKALQNARTKLQKIIRKRNRQLERDAAELGRRFYAEPDKAFAKRISIFVRDWAS